MMRELDAGSSCPASKFGTGSITPVGRMVNESSWPLHSLLLKRAWYTRLPVVSEVEFVATEEADDTCRM